MQNKRLFAKGIVLRKKAFFSAKEYRDLYNAFKNKAMSEQQLAELTEFMASRLGMKPTIAASAALEAYDIDALEFKTED